MAQIFESACPRCQGDLQFAIGLTGPELKCMQCSREVTREQAAAMLAAIQVAQVSTA